MMSQNLEIGRVSVEKSLKDTDCGNIRSIEFTEDCAEHSVVFSGVGSAGSLGLYHQMF
jgi:hypothetical protein